MPDVKAEDHPSIIIVYLYTRQSVLGYVDRASNRRVKGGYFPGNAKITKYYLYIECFLVINNLTDTKNSELLKVTYEIIWIKTMLWLQVFLQLNIREN